MKKLISLFLACALCLGLLAGCGSEKSVDWRKYPEIWEQKEQIMRSIEKECAAVGYSLPPLKETSEETIHGPEDKFAVDDLTVSVDYKTEGPVFSVGLVFTSKQELQFIVIDVYTGELEKNPEIFKAACKGFLETGIFDLTEEEKNMILERYEVEYNNGNYSIDIRTLNKYPGKSASFLKILPRRSGK